MVNNLIDKRAEIDAICKHFNYDENDDFVYWNREHVLRVLRDLPSAQPDVPDINVGDMISRRAAIDAMKAHRALYCDNTPDTFSKLSYAEKSRVDELDTAIATLVNLPSAQPERKPGKWLDSGTGGDQYNAYYLYKCSKCKSVFDNKSNFCPHCGARMEGEG